MNEEYVGTSCGGSRTVKELKNLVNKLAPNLKQYDIVAATLCVRRGGKARRSNE
jgi:hypothetical protein